ncbi:unnamed protein product [Malus baccata var. baccata]
MQKEFKRDGGTALTLRRNSSPKTINHRVAPLARPDQPAIRIDRHAPRKPGKEKGRWWAFGKVGPIECLHSSSDTEEKRNKVRGRGSGKRVESIRLGDREKQNEIRIWPKKKQRYGYHDRSPSIKKNLSKSLRVSRAFKHPKYIGVVNGIVFLIENDDPFRKTKLFKFFLPKKSRSDGSTILNHFVAPGVAEPFTMGGANAQGRSLDKRIRSRIALFVESLTSDKKCLAEAKKRLTRFIRQANDLRFAGTTKTTIPLFPFFGATFFFPRDGDAREQLLGQLRIKCWNLMAACDGRISSPVPTVGLHPEVPADTGVPQGAPVQIDEIPPEVPQLCRPLMGDAFRTRELHLRLGLYFMGRNTWRDNCVLLGILEKQVLWGGIVREGSETKPSH